MPGALELHEKPIAQTMFMIAGWRQWADAGSISSGLPRYLIRRTKARKIGNIKPDGFYLFQIPGTHHLVRPVVSFDSGFPSELSASENNIYYAGDQEKGMVFFIGDEPHMDVERYSEAFLEIAQELKVTRIITFGGVYGELPYDKERIVSSIYSRTHLKDELENLAVNLSDYQGGASIGSYICKRASERQIDFVSFYAFVPTYDFSEIADVNTSIRLENDFMAWLGVMRRVNYMLDYNFDLSDLERKSQRLVRLLDSKIDEIENIAPQLGVRDYLAGLSAEFDETLFEPLGEVWEEEFRRLFDEGESE